MANANRFRAIGALCAVAAVLLPLQAATAAKPPTRTVVLPNGRAISIPVQSGKVAQEISQPGLLIPKGFPISSLPTSAADYPKLGQGHESGEGPNVVGMPATYDGNVGHFSTWRWGGQISPTPVRALIILDRTDIGERAAVNDFVYAWQNFVRQRLKNLGLSDAKVPQITYMQDSGAMGQCVARGTWTFVNYSFTTICTSWNMAANCSAGQIGCAWTTTEADHAGTVAQPNVWISAGNTGTRLRNLVHHELFHTMGMPHNVSQSCSVMDPAVNTCNGDYQDKNLTSDDDWYLANKYNHNPD